MQVMVLGSQPVTIDDASMQGVLVAPKSAVTISTGGSFSGAALTGSLTMQSGTAFHEDKGITTGKFPVVIPGTYTSTWTK